MFMLTCSKSNKIALIQPNEIICKKLCFNTQDLSSCIQIVQFCTPKKGYAYISF